MSAIPTAAPPPPLNRKSASASSPGIGGPSPEALFSNSSHRSMLRLERVSLSGGTNLAIIRYEARRKYFKKISSKYVDDNKDGYPSDSKSAESQPFQNKAVNLVSAVECEKKGDLILKVCLQKLLKTHIEKMSVSEPEQKLMIRNGLKISSKYVDDNK
jgi:hypothetical protein